MRGDTRGGAGGGEEEGNQAAFHGCRVVLVSRALITALICGISSVHRAILAIAMATAKHGAKEKKKKRKKNDNEKVK